MKLLFKQRFFSWFDSYDIYNEKGEAVYSVRGQLSWGHCLKIFDSSDREIATVKEAIFTFLPKFELYIDDRFIGCIRKEFSLFKPSFSIDCNGWRVSGDFFEWDYSILDGYGNEIATISKQLFNFTDTYVIDVNNQKDALVALMLVLAIDAEKCSRDSN